MNQEPENTDINRLISLDGKNAVVTGGVDGIGAAIVRRLAQAGARVFIADVCSEIPEKTKQEFAEHIRKISLIQCDVSQEEQVKAMIDRTSGEAGMIDILVNNAGIYPRKPFLEMTGGDFSRVLNVNLLGTFLCSLHAGREMIKQRREGSIINIASIEAVHPSSTGMTAYDASKGGVLMLTRSLARELGPHGIRVNAIAPGGILTQAIVSHTSRQTPGEERAGLKELKAFMGRMALGRMGEPDDIARVALFLASDMAGYITGEMIVVDGGYLVS
jgi:NAD(P)-dependent dehydrogenase (short-subunit alcohol dehydrogenase family)